MILADLQDRDQVFIDANVIIYHFMGQSLDCKNFLERCANRELHGYTSTLVLAEILHRLMVAEAIAKRLVTVNNPVKKLGKTPALVKQLTQYQENVNKIIEMNVTILDLKFETVKKSADFRKNEGLLTNDSMIIAFMHEHGLSKLATANGDFDQVSGIEVYKPTDLIQSMH